MAITGQRKLELLGQSSGISGQSIMKSGGAKALFGKDSDVTDAERAELTSGNGLFEFADLAEGFHFARSGRRATTAQQGNVKGFQSFLGGDSNLQSLFDAGKQTFETNRTSRESAKTILGGLDKEIFNFKSQQQGSGPMPNITIQGITVANSTEGRQELELKLLQKNLSADQFSFFKQEQQGKNQKKISQIEKELARWESEADPVAQGHQDQRLLTQNRENRKNRLRSQLNRLTFGDAGHDIFDIEGATRSIGNVRMKEKIQNRVGKSRSGGGTVSQEDADLEMAAIDAQTQYETSGSEEDKLALQNINKDRMANGSLQGPSGGSDGAPLPGSYNTQEEALAAGQAAAGQTDGSGGVSGESPITTDVNPDVVSQFEGADSNTILDAIRSGELTADSNDANWRALYKNGYATVAQRDAHNQFQQETGGNQSSGFNSDVISQPGGGDRPGNRTPHLDPNLNPDGTDSLGTGGSPTGSEDVLKTLEGGGAAAPIITNESVTGALMSGTITTSEGLGKYAHIADKELKAHEEMYQNERLVSEQNQGRWDKYTLEAAQRDFTIFQKKNDMIDKSAKEFADAYAGIRTATKKSFGALEDRTELERDLAIEELALEKERSTNNYNADIVRQQKENDRQRIIGQTWSGVTGGFDTATNKRLATAAQTGIDVMHRLTKENNLDNKEFGQTFRKIQSEFLADLNILTAQKDERLAAINLQATETATGYWEDKTLNEEQKLEKINALAVFKTQQTNDAATAMVNSLNQKIDRNKTLVAGYEMQILRDRAAAMAKGASVAKANDIIKRALANGGDAAGTRDYLVNEMGMDNMTATDMVNNADFSKTLAPTGIFSPQVTDEEAIASLKSRFGSGLFSGYENDPDAIAKRKAFLQKERDRSAIGNSQGAPVQDTTTIFDLAGPDFTVKEGLQIEGLDLKNKKMMQDLGIPFE